MKKNTNLKRMFNTEALLFPELIENDAWDVIESLDWFTKKLKYGYFADEEICTSLLDSNICVDDLVVLQNFIIDKRNELKNLVLDIYPTTDQEELDKFCSSVVGCGRAIYYFYLSHPYCCDIRNQQKRNCYFENGFDLAIHEIFCS